MKSYKHILLGAAIAILLFCSFGFYDTDTFSDGTYQYFGSDRDASLNWDNSSSDLDFAIATGRFHFTSSVVADGSYGTLLSGSISTATKSEGLGLYIEGNTSGAADGKVYAAGIWLNITDGTPTDGPDSLMAALDIGIYAAAAPELATTQLRVLNIEYQVHTDAAPVQTSSMMHFNCDDTGDVPDYWFTTGNIAAVNYIVNTNTSSCNVTVKAGVIKVYIGAQGARYLWLYNAAGS